jgi:rRNA maturation RNase YbeY
VDIARREAMRRRLVDRVEILRYVIHGTLHLLGYDDATPAQRRRMRGLENAVLKDVRSFRSRRT